MLVAGSQNTGHRAKISDLGKHTWGGVLSTPATGDRSQKSVINHSSPVLRATAGLSQSQQVFAFS